eukprot:scaffold21638_cov223-Skeletonema_marinoi.AAC.1
MTVDRNGELVRTSGIPLLGSEMRLADSERSKETGKRETNDKQTTKKRTTSQNLIGSQIQLTSEQHERTLQSSQRVSTME